MRSRLFTLLFVVALGSAAVAVYRFDDSEIAGRLIVGIGSFVMAVWLMSRFIIFLNTRM